MKHMFCEGLPKSVSNKSVLTSVNRDTQIRPFNMYSQDPGKGHNLHRRFCVERCGLKRFECSLDPNLCPKNCPGALFFDVGHLTHKSPHCLPIHGRAILLNGTRDISGANKPQYGIFDEFPKPINPKKKLKAMDLDVDLPIQEDIHDRT